jgi:hypothetical protein
MNARSSLLQPRSIQRFITSLQTFQAWPRWPNYLATTPPF